MMEYYPNAKIRSKLLNLDQNILKYLFYVTKKEQNKNVSQLCEN